MTTVKFYAADLAAYDAGCLHGAWVEATSDVDEMQEAIAKMLRDSPCPNVLVRCPECDNDLAAREDCSHCNGHGNVESAEEWQVHDYDDELGAISHLGETSDLETIAEIMEAVEEIEDDHDATRLPILIKWLAEHGDPIHWKSTLDDAYAGEWSDPEDYAADLAESCGYMTGDDNPVLRYVDFRAMARDMALGGEMDFICLSTGRHLQDYDDMRGRECVALRNF